MCTHTGQKAGRIRGPARGLSRLCIRGDYLWAPRVRVQTTLYVCVAKSFSGSGLALSLSLSPDSLALPLSCVYVCQAQGCNTLAHIYASALASPSLTGLHVCARIRVRVRELRPCACARTRESGINPGLLVVCAPPAVQIQNPTHTTQLILTHPLFTLSRLHLVALTTLPSLSYPMCSPPTVWNVLYRVCLKIHVRQRPIFAYPLKVSIFERIIVRH